MANLENQRTNDSALVQNQNPAQSHFKAARAFVQQQQWQEAIVQYQKAILQDPDGVVAYLELGNVWLKLEQWSEAVVCYKQVINRQPRAAQAYHQLGDALSKLQKWKQAITAYHKAIELNPKFSWSYNNLGDVLIQLEQWEEATKAYDKAIQLNPDFALSYHNLGEAYSHINQWSNAIRAYQNAIQLDSNFVWSYYNLADSLVQENRWHEAIQAYQSALELEENLPEINLKLADTFKQKVQEDYARLLSIYREKIQQDPEDIQNYYKVLELEPNDAQLYLKLGKILAQKGQLDQAIVAYQRVLQLQPDDQEASHLLEKVLHRPETQWNPKLYTSDEVLSQGTKLDQAKQILDKINHVTLENFLNTGATLHFPEVEDPEVSIILVLYNRAELTLSCLYSILRNNFKSLEVILVDNCSRDETRTLLQRIQGCKIILNQENLHFLLACNQASQVAQGNFLLFLNNDTQLLGDSITAAIKTIKSSDDIGAVGGKMILPDGSLQEAGSIIWQDGSCLGYGRGDSPSAPQYMFQRSVDYCSGAFLLTSRQLFLELGKFDEDYQPAYYEETDYCVRLQRLGKKIIYDPNVTLLHYEFASSSNTGSSEHAIALMNRNQKLLKEKHQDWFKQQYPPDIKNVLFARTHARENQKRLLLIDDRVPHPYLGSGYTRSHKILSILVDAGYAVTLYPTDLSYLEDWTSIYADISQEVEVIRGYGLLQLETFLRERKGYYDVVMVSRPHNMEHLNYVLSQDNLLDDVKIIYDAEALYCLREFEQKRLQGEEVSASEKQTIIEQELKLAHNCDWIISVSEAEKQRFLDCGYDHVAILGHSLNLNPTPNSFEQRQHILFVGSVYELESPNADAILWLCEEIFPLIQAQLGQKVKLLIAGNNTVEELTQKVHKCDNYAIQMLGRVDDLTALYNQSRLFVAPTRFAAGIPHKVHEAAAHGLPVVTTSLIATQLTWKNEDELLVAESSVEFANQCVRLYNDIRLWNELRLGAMKKVKVECSPESFSRNLKSILKSE